MKAIYKLDKSFGPTASAAGIVIFVIGIATLFVSIYGIVLVIIGAFLGFTCTCTRIDFAARRIKFTEKLFGFIPIGKWIKLNRSMHLGIRNSNVVWRSFSRGSRALDIETDDYRLILFDAENNELLTVKKANTLTSAINDCKNLSNTLKISMLT